MRSLKTADTTVSKREACRFCYFSRTKSSGSGRSPGLRNSLAKAGRSPGLRKSLAKAALIAALIAVFSGCAGKEMSGTSANVQTLPSGAAEQSSPAETVRPAKYIITCDEIAGKALSDKNIEHPRTMLVEDDKMMSDVIGYDVSLTSDYSVNIQLVSADLFELTVMRVPEENGGAVLDMLEKRRDYLIEMAAAYPKQKAAADATVVGHVDDVYFLICSENATELEKLVISAAKHN